MKAYTMKKRFGALALALAMCLGMLAGCGGNEKPAEPAPTQPAATEPAATEPAPTEPALPTMEDEFGNGAVGTNCAVTSADPQASQAGVDIMMAGGNAVDAAVATAFCVGVVEPWLSGIGGCGMMNIFLNDTDEYKALEYMETVPVALEPGMYNPDTDKYTAKNAAVPGQVAGLAKALELYGTMSLAEVLEPAIKLARDGFVVSERLADILVDAFAMFEGESAEVFLKDGLPYEAGDIMKNEKLAYTLQTIADKGIEAFYEGEIAEQMISVLQANGSMMAMEDLAAYEVMERDPISTTYYGYEVVTVPPPSNGGDWLLEMLNIMEEVDISQYELNSAEYLHVFNEACGIALIDSYSYIGDPAFFNLPIEQMTSKEFAAERAQLINVDDMKALPEIPLSDLPVEKLNPTGEESLHTTHLVVMDPAGNIVSTTNTLGNGWGCQFYAEGLGFYYNSHVNNLDHSNPDSPDYVMPGKRVRSTISPSFVLKDGEPVMAIGSPGSLAIPPAIAGVINNVLLYDMELQNAVNLPRAQRITRSKGQNPPTLTIEQARFDPETIAALEAMGYTMKDCGEYSSSVGGIATLLLDADAGVIYAAGDPRRGYFSAAN